MTDATIKKRKPSTGKRTAEGRTKKHAAPERPLTELERKLLSVGGELVSRQVHDDPHTAQLLARGKVFDLPVKMKRGEPHRCHANAAGLWGKDVRRLGLVTGYGLAGDCWVQHSWVVGDGLIYETTVRFDLYFGVLLDDDLATLFWFANYLAERYPGPMALLRDAMRKAEQATA